MGRYIIPTLTIKPRKNEIKRHNKTYKKYLTKYQTIRMRKQNLVVVVGLFASITIGMLIQLAAMTNSYTINGHLVSAGLPVEQVVMAETSFSAPLPVKGAIRTITAYNAGDPAQTDNSPCISASGDNICNLLAKGEKICAANFVKLGTKLKIEGLGVCTVLDRMNSRYPDRVDWAMEAHQKAEALKFNKKLLVIIIKK